MNDKCVEIKPSCNGFNDVSCDKNRPYVCEIAMD